jgi:hypothetical protein
VEAQSAPVEQGSPRVPWLAPGTVPQWPPVQTELQQSLACAQPASTVAQRVASQVPPLQFSEQQSVETVQALPGLPQKPTSPHLKAPASSDAQTPVQHGSPAPPGWQVALGPRQFEPTRPVLPEVPADAPVLPLAPVEPVPPVVAETHVPPLQVSPLAQSLVFEHLEPATAPLL